MNNSESFEETTEEMSERENQSTENSGLMRNASKPHILNIINNTCAIICFALVVYLSFYNGAVLFSFHPICMTLAWLLLMPMAVNAITPGDMATEWMPIRLRSTRHWIIQTAAGIFGTLGFFIILSNKIIHGKSHFVTLHAIFGLTSVIFMVMTASGGIGALYSLKLKQYLPPIWMKLIHGFFGLVTFSLGTVTMILALYSAWFTFGEVLRYTCFLLILIVLITTVLRPGIKIYMRVKERYRL